MARYTYCLDLTHYASNAKKPLYVSRCKKCRSEKTKAYQKKRYTEDPEFRRRKINCSLEAIKKYTPEQKAETAKRKKKTKSYVRGIYRLPKDTPDDFVETLQTLQEFKRVVRKLKKDEKEKQPIQIEQTFEGNENVGNSQ